MDDATKQDIKRLDEINAARLKDKTEVWDALMKDCPVHMTNSSLIEKSGVVHIELEHPMARSGSKFSWENQAPFVGFYVATIEACAGVSSPVYVIIRRLDPGPWCVIALCQEQRYMDGSVKFVLHEEEIGLTTDDTKEERTAKIQAAAFLGLTRLRKITEDYDGGLSTPRRTADQERAHGARLGFDKQSDTEEPTFD